MTNYELLLKKYSDQLLKAISYLEASSRKVAKLESDVLNLSSDDLEKWEAFVARFCRVADIYLARYLRASVLKEDPGFRGTLRDFLNQAEKQGLINSARTWLEIRELRNTAAHEYLDEKQTEIFEKTRANAKTLIKIKEGLNIASK